MTANREELLRAVEREISRISINTEITDLLFEYQVPHVQNLIYALKRYGLACDASDTGTGKTFTACAAAKQLGFRPFIIGPKSVIPDWYKTCLQFEIAPLGVVNYETIKNGKYYADLCAFDSEAREDCPYIDIKWEIEKDPLTGEPLLTKTGKPKKIMSQVIWKLPPKTLIIFDEAHKAKNGLNALKKSLNSQLIVSVKGILRTELPPNSEREIYGLFLSATLTDKLENFDVMLYLFGFYSPYDKKNYNYFLHTLGYNPDSEKLKLQAYKKINSLLFPLRGSRIRIDKLPAGTFQENDVKAKAYPVSSELAKAIESEYHKLHEAMDSLREKGESNALGRIIRCWVKIEALKSTILADRAIKYLQKGYSPVIFINYNETKKLIVERLVSSGVISLDKIEFIHGGQSGMERSVVIDKFKKDEIFCVIANINAGGVAVSLQDILGNRPRRSLISPTWNAISIKQALGRIHRAGAKTSAVQRIIYSKPSRAQINPDDDYLSIEELICANVNVKLQNIDLLNDDDLSRAVQIL